MICKLGHRPFQTLALAAVAEGESAEVVVDEAVRTATGADASYIQAVGWDDSRCPVARTLLTYSQSENPKSPHFSDQTRLYAGERWVTSRFCEKDIARSPDLRVVRVHERR